MKLKYGIDEKLEEIATEILMADRRKKQHNEPTRKYSYAGIKGKLGNPSAWHMDEINDWFTEDQWDLRMSREIFNTMGFVGDYFRWNGLFNRAYNPMIGKRPGPKYLYRPGMDPWCQQIWEEIDNWWYHPGKFVRRGSISPL